MNIFSLRSFNQEVIVLLASTGHKKVYNSWRKQSVLNIFTMAILHCAVWTVHLVYTCMHTVEVTFSIDNAGYSSHWWIIRALICCHLRGGIQLKVIKKKHQKASDDIWLQVSKSMSKNHSTLCPLTKIWCFGIAWLLLKLSILRIGNARLAPS